MTQQNERWNIIHAVAGAIALNMINPYIGILAIKLGADNLQLGFLSSWPQLASAVAVLGVAAVVARSAQKQRLIAIVQLAGRAAALGAAAVPWFPAQTRVWALIGFWVLYIFPTSASGGAAMQSFLADVFPGSQRGRAFAARQSWATGAGIAVLLITGLLLDWLPEPLGYQLLFALSCIFAGLELVAFMRMRPPQEPEGAAGGQGGATRGLGAYMAVFRHRPFVQFLLCSIPFHFTWQMAWPLFTRFQVTELQITNTWLSLTTVANSLTAVLTYPLWARWAERRGNRAMMAQAALQMALAPILTAIVPSVPWLVVVNLITGVGMAGTTLQILNTQLEVSPAEGRPVYLAVHAALVSVSATIAPMVGAYMMDLWPVRQGLIISTFFRLLTALFFYIWILTTRRQQGKPAPSENVS